MNIEIAINMQELKKKKTLKNECSQKDTRDIEALKKQENVISLRRDC